MALLTASITLVTPGAAHASTSALGGGPAAGVAPTEAEQELADRFAPVVMLVRHDEPCGPGEPYRPTDVDAILDNPGVALRGPWQGDSLVKVGPSAADLAAGLDGYYLDLPGNPLKPGCTYEEWTDRVSAGTEPTVYAHVATQADRPDQLALQYWFYYPYNDYNNKHESDWEQIQILFDAGTAEEALDQEPVAVGYSQHEGLETAEWGEDKLQIVDGTHPVVHPAAGSHANYYDAALYLGRSGTQGFGCDDTRNPGDPLDPAVVVIPQDPAAASETVPWVDYVGHWGQQERAFYNGPTGPITKTSWASPITDQEERGRDRSYAVPAAGTLGTGTTDFFCGAVGGGSNVLRVILGSPGLLLTILGVLFLCVIALIRRTQWRPATPLRLYRRRAGGQIVGSAGRIYRSRAMLFAGIGTLTIPLSILAGLLQGLIVDAPVSGVAEGGEVGGWRVLAAGMIGYLVVGYGVVLVHAATTRALAELDAGREVGIAAAYRSAWASARPLLVAFLLGSAVLAVCSLTLVLLPVAIALFVAVALFVQCVVLEGRPGVAAMLASVRLVRHQVLRVGLILGVASLLTAVVGPLLGTLLILTSGLPFWAANLVSGVTFAFLMPFVALTLTYVYADAKVRDALAARTPRAPDVLPAELDSEATT